MPDDRTDVLYHLYEGGGIQIDGPSILVRKKVGKSVSFVSNYYVDMISSASIDVVTTASPYTEERTQWSLGMDYLRGNTTITPTTPAASRVISMQHLQLSVSARTCLVI